MRNDGGLKLKMSLSGVAFVLPLSATRSFTLKLRISFPLPLYVSLAAFVFCYLASFTLNLKDVYRGILSV